METQANCHEMSDMWNEIQYSYTSQFPRRIHPNHTAEARRAKYQSKTGLSKEEASSVNFRRAREVAKANPQRSLMMAQYNSLKSDHAQIRQQVRNLLEIEARATKDSDEYREAYRVYQDLVQILIDKKEEIKEYFG
jgi:hypothetical protein